MTPKELESILKKFNSFNTFERDFVVEYNNQEVLIFEDGAVVGSIGWTSEPTESEKVSSIYSLVLDLQMQ